MKVRGVRIRWLELGLSLTDLFLYLCFLSLRGFQNRQDSLSDTYESGVELDHWLLSVP